MPKAPITRPPPQHSAATAPALRGPARSSQPPQIAAETPSTTKNSVYIQPMLATFQSQVVVKSSCTQRNIRASFRCGEADRARQRQPEHAEPIGHTDAEMNTKRGRWHEPAVEAWLRDRVLAIENPRSVTRRGPRAADCRHSILPCSRPLPGMSAFSVFYNQIFRRSAKPSLCALHNFPLHPFRATRRP